MTRLTQHTIPASELADMMADPARGIFSLVGGNGGLSLITGDISSSSLLFGALSVETEHGTIYVAPDETLVVSEALPYGSEHEWLVSWEIDSYGATPKTAAMRVWRETFGRTIASHDDACVFTVTDSETKTVHRIDLSEYAPDTV